MEGILSLEELRVRGFLEEDYTDADLRHGERFVWEVIELFTGRQFENENITLKLDGFGIADLSLPIAIDLIESVIMDDTVLVKNTDYIVYNRRLPDDRENPKLVRLNGVWNSGNQNITVTGRFGYTDPKSDSMHPPKPLIEVAMRLMPIVFENILEDGERDVDISSVKRGIQKEVTDRWTYVKFDREPVYQLLDDGFMNAILLMYRRGDSIISLDYVWGNMNPTINPTKVRVYKINPNTEKHDYRNRPKDKENNYEFVKLMKLQPVWYSQKELRQQDQVDREQSSGYFLFKNSHLGKLGINPADNNSWARYRFLPKINGYFSDDFLEIIEIKPESPHRGSYKLWYAKFHEVRPEPQGETTDITTEDSGEFDKNINEMVDVIKRNY